MDTTIKRKLIEEVFGQCLVGRDGINVATACPFCKEKKTGKLKFSIRLDDNRYHCWVCESKGKNIWSLISRIRPDLHDKISSYLNGSSKNQIQLLIPQQLDLPDGLIPLWRPIKQPDALACLSYLTKRGINAEEIIRFRIMAGVSGTFRRHVFFPSFDTDGKLNYYIARCIDETKFKYKNASIPKSSIIFNEIDIDWKSSVVLVEGIFDAIAVGFNAIPVLGSTVPKNSELWNKLVSNSCDVVIAFDSDLPQKAYTLARDLHNAGCQIRLCFPNGYKDWAEAPRSIVRNLIENSKFHNEYDLIHHKINSIRSGSIL